jgi:hypothetical protein
MDPSGLVNPFVIAGYLILIVIVVLLWAQVFVNYKKFFGFTTAERNAAIRQNQRAMVSLQRIIDSNGEITFQNEGLRVGGTLGATLPGNSAYTRLANQFERLANVEGWPSAVEELFTRVANSAYEGVPSNDSHVTADQRVELAKAWLHRSQAFERWLKRDY